ncbi:hypothetical protein OGAPHI_006509 [Ogataea philodendri]|uniref:Uncharacterized protein n=1 Tax=Ogataea philodendri TaxID=1378263 RepID=A0A9P8NY95_9ASCO|nr:uncharacterized protein OGAPHI_006509 [Ogataea philodendri]KAH3661659.1 hypothetical protein OGAPHI_006509 [Ogataea philodendri]
MDLDEAAILGDWTYSLLVHQVELSVNLLPSIGNGSGVGQHTDSSAHVSKLRLWGLGWLLVANTNLESRWTPVNQLHSLLRLDHRNGVLNVSVDNVTSVKQTCSHVLTKSWVALDHLVAWLETSSSDFGNGVGLVGHSGLGHHWGVRDQWEVDSWVWHQVGLELVQVNVQRTVESQGCRHGRNNLGNQVVEVVEAWSGNVEVLTAHFVNGLVIDHEGTVSVLQSGVGGQNSVVRLNNRSRHLRSRVNCKLELGLLTVIVGELFQKQRSQSGTGTTSKRVCEQETLQTVTLVGHLSQSVANVVQ